jgi:hypothetical protein
MKPIIRWKNHHTRENMLVYAEEHEIEEAVSSFKNAGCTDINVQYDQDMQTYIVSSSRRISANGGNSNNHG